MSDIKFSRAISRFNVESNAIVSETSSVSVGIWLNIDPADRPRKFYIKKLIIMNP
jgi:hypothetical protein